MPAYFIQDAFVNSKGCSFIVALAVVAVGMGVGYYKFRVQQEKALHDSRIAQWHGPLLAMLNHPVRILFRNQAFSVSGYLCGEYTLGVEPAGTSTSTFQRFVVSPDAVALSGARAYTPSNDARARKQRRRYQAQLDAMNHGGATATHAVDKVAWDPHCH